MRAAILTAQVAKEAKFEIVENGRYSQAVHDVVVALQAGRRSGSANTKTKAEVNLSGAKPWRQKGTGRARAGYKSSPVWVGGGVVFGPKPRDYSKKVNKGTKRIALRKALSERIKDGDVLLVADFAVKEPKTKHFVSLMMELTPEKKTLVIAKSFDQATLRAARNDAKSQLVTSRDVNTEHILKFKKILITRDGLAEVAERTFKQ